MNNSCPDLYINDETIDDKLACLSHELSLAQQWQRPSLLFAIYDTDAVRNLAQNSLEEIVKQSGQNVVHYQIEYGKNIDLNLFLQEISEKSKDIFYIYPRQNDGDKTRIDNFISMLNSCRGFLVEKLIRTVFWLTEKEALKVAHEAPDFWASRHRVIEFLGGSPKDQDPAQTNNHPATQTPTKPNEIAPAFLDTLDLQAESPMVIDIKDGDEPAFSGINLLLMMGVANWKDRNLEKALESLMAALAIAEKSGNKDHQIMCHKAIALVQSDQGNSREAIQAYQRVIELGPENVAIWNNLGSLYLKTGKFDDALEAFSNAVQGDPNDQVSWHGMGNVYASKGHPDEAINCYRKSIKINSGYVAPWIQLARVLIRQNRFDDALYAYMRIVEMDKKNVHAWSEIGNIYLKAGAFEQSIDAYKKALKLGDTSPDTHKNLAIAQTNSGYFSEAIPVFQKAIELETDTVEKASLCNLLGDVYRKVGDYENAVTYYGSADKYTQPGTELPHEQAFPSLDKPTSEPAKQTTEIGLTEVVGQEKFESLHAKVASPANDIVQLIAISQDDHPAVSETSQAVIEGLSSVNEPSSQAQQKVDLLGRLAEMYINLGRQDKAIDTYQKVLEVQPSDWKSLFELGQLYTQRGDPLKAISYHQLSLETAPTLKKKASSLNFIGDLYRQLKDYSSALDAYWAAFGADPNNEIVMANLGKVQADVEQMAVSDNQPANNPSAAGASILQTVPSQAQAALLEQSQSNQNEATSTDDNKQVKPLPKIDLNNPDVWNELGNIYARSNLLDEAVEAYQKAIALKPEFGWSYSNLAAVLVQQGRQEEAVSSLQKSLELLWSDKDKAQVWNRMGDILRHAGQYSRAIEAYQNADSLKQDNHALSSPQVLRSEKLFSHFVS